MSLKDKLNLALKLLSNQKVKYLLVFLVGLLSSKLLAYLGYQVLMHAAKQCLETYPQLPGFFIPICMQSEHPVLVLIGKLLNLTF
ncbi:hypothetical protein EBR43_05080 [bacterium]|nr:hypothetical protein [bacterium]